MAILATFKSDHGTVLAFTSFDISVINKFPLCVLQLDFKVAQESGHVKWSIFYFVFFRISCQFGCMVRTSSYSVR